MAPCHPPPPPGSVGLDSYDIDLCSYGPTLSMSTGEVVDITIIDLLSSISDQDEYNKRFADECLVTSLFHTLEQSEHQ